MSVTVSLSTLVQAATLAALAYGVYYVYYLFFIKPYAFEKYWRDQGVSGAPYKPPLGQLSLIQAAADSDRIVEYAQGMARKYGLLQTQIIGPLCQIVVYDPEVARAIFTSRASCYHKASEWEKDIMRPLLHNGLLLSEDAYWKQQRTLVSPGFHWWYLQEMLPIINDCVAAWVNKVQQQLDATGKKEGEAEVELEMSHELATITLDSVATAAFGAGFRADPQRADRFIHSLKLTLDNMQARTLNLLGFIPGVRSLPLPSLRAIRRGCGEIDAIVREIVADRKAGRSSVVAGGSHAGSAMLAANGQEQRRRDLLDLLLDAQANMPEGQVLTDRGVEEESINFIAAGAETTSNLCVWMLWRIVTEGEGELMRRVVEEIDRVCEGAHPDAEQMKELKLLEAVAYESLRLHPPAPTIPKHAIESHDIPLSDGRTIHVPRGTTLLLNANVIHRLDEYWPNPDLFRPERFLSSAIGAEPSPSASPSPNASSSDSTSATASGEDAASPRSAAAEKARKAAAPFAFLGFSAGPRKCIGKNLAMLEIKSIFTLLFQNFELELVDGQYIAANAITRLPKNGIRFRVRRRQAPLGAYASLNPALSGDDADASQQQGAEDAQQGGEVRQRAPVSVLKPIGMI